MTRGHRIVKMSGTGNDFVMLTGSVASALADGLKSWIRGVCRRGLSVGADGVLVVESTGRDRVAVRFFNPDGSSAFCGNGTRCAARFAFLERLAGPMMVLETAVGDVPAEVHDEFVRITLPPPVDLGPRKIQLPTATLEGRYVDAGVPHFVVAVDDVDRAPLAVWGPAARRHATFGDAGVNLDLVSSATDDRDVIDLRTWERGVEGETLACGTGAVAAALAERIHGADRTIELRPRSGRRLKVTLPGDRTAPEAAILEGDARVVLEGWLAPEGVLDESF